MVLSGLHTTLRSHKHKMIYLYVCVHTLICTHEHTRTYVLTNTHTHTHTHTHTRTCTCTQTTPPPTPPHTHTHACTHARTHARTHLHFSISLFILYAFSDHIVECHKVEGAEGQCTTQGAASDLTVTLLHRRNLTLTFGKTSRKDEGRYTMDMLVNDAQLNSTSCSLTIEGN